MFLAGQRPKHMSQSVHLLPNKELTDLKASSDAHGQSNSK